MASIAPPTVVRSTPQPGGRRTAAAVALGAPRGGSVTRAKAAPMPKAAKAPAKLPKAQAQKAPAKAARTVFNPVEGVMGAKEIRSIAHNEAQEVLKSELEPLRGEQKEIGQNELGASERYQQNAGAANNLLGSIAAGQEASAKTFENQAADNALTAGKAIETSGQTQASMTGGFVSPELRAQLNAEASRESAAGAANNTFAQSSAQAAGNLQAGLRSAAALRSVEGQDKLTGYFQKQASKVGEDENTRIAKAGADQAKFEESLGQKNVTDYATLQSLGLKTTEAQNKTATDKAEIAEKSAKIPLIKAETTEDREKAIEAIGKGELNSAKTKKELAKIGPEIAKLNAGAEESAAKAKEDLAKTLAKTQGGGVSADSELKLVGELASSYSYVKEFRSQGAKSLSPQQIRQVLHTGETQDQETKGSGSYSKKETSIKGVANPAIVNAAIELYYYHTVSPATQAALKQAGISRTPAELAAAVGV